MLGAGARLVVVGKDAGSCARAEKTLGTQTVVIQADATDPACARQAVATCRKHWGSIHALYHVAGGSGRSQGDGPLHELSLEGWQYTLALNLGSVMLSNQAAIQAFLEQGNGGSILNMSSVLAFSPSPEYFATHAYSAAKAGIIGLSKSLAAYYAGQGIRVNVIAPALVDTPMAGRAASDARIMQYIRHKQPLDGGRIGRPEDLDGLVCYFMSEQSRFTTGQVVAVDGGWSVSEGHP